VTYCERNRLTEELAFDKSRRRGGKGGGVRTVCKAEAVCARNQGSTNLMGIHLGLFV